MLARCCAAPSCRTVNQNTKSGVNGHGERDVAVSLALNWLVAAGAAYGLGAGAGMRAAREAWRSRMATNNPLTSLVQSSHR